MKMRLVFFTGSGISAESGIPTFRGADGLWEGHRVEDVASPEAWMKDPQLVTQFYNERRKNCLMSQPNEAHLIISRLERDCEVQVITQNVDDLHERAGSKNVLHLHGELMKMRSQADDLEIKTAQEIFGSPSANLEVPCPNGMPWRPHIVWFGEEVPMMNEAMRIVSEADCLVIIGTSLVVYPAATLIHFVQKDVPVFIIDPNAAELRLPSNFQIFDTGASEGMQYFYDWLKKSNIEFTSEEDWNENE